MARFIKGDVVVVPFPFSDLSTAKRRPGIVISVLDGEDRILCQITSRAIRDKYAIELKDDDFENGNLRQKRNIRPNRIFTCDTRIILYRIGKIKAKKMETVINKLIEIIKS